MKIVLTQVIDIYILINIIFIYSKQAWINRFS